jgi:hypothetical protein
MTLKYTSLISEDECIGDSLDTINSNFSALDVATDSLSSQFLNRTTQYFVLTSNDSAQLSKIYFPNNYITLKPNTLYRVNIGLGSLQGSTASTNAIRLSGSASMTGSFSLNVAGAITSTISWVAGTRIENTNQVLFTSPQTVMASDNIFINIIGYIQTSNSTTTLLVSATSPASTSTPLAGSYWETTVLN